ncbi:hypothetical protein E2562_022810 [Oryza meyeriana var. granulata]|uniref:Retrotransposon gag domain-containing protein n=1 Tax=Oryza meyeriana var. granulata TaxID=110450 RepID=A0A6G1FB35_9ORYZ|nr:hypothetical protein E2562_022810 [Oryza meyeriana var. granulata]
MENELRALRQASREGAGRATPGSSAAIAIGQDEPTTRGPKSGVSLKEWVGMTLDNFDGSSTPVQAANWLSYVEDKMEAFEVLAQDRVRYGTQLLKGEAQIWWKEFVRQFERRFYPDKKTVAEYEIGFNQIVRFVPHVAHDEVEKARQFRQGLKPAILHVLGTFTIIDFRSMVEQALGVEMQLIYTADLYKSSGGVVIRTVSRSVDGLAIWGLLVAPRHYSFDTRGSLGSCTSCSYYGSLFFD